MPMHLKGGRALKRDLSADCDERCRQRRTVRLDPSSKEHKCLAFLAQLEYILWRNTSITVTEILGALTSRYVYFEEFRRLITSESNTIQTVTASAARLYHFLVTSDRQTAAARVFGDFLCYFSDTEGKRMNVTEVSQVKILVKTIQDHFSSHHSHEFVPSVGIAGIHRVTELLKDQCYEGRHGYAGDNDVRLADDPPPG
ncbi:hypothetical protein ATETN484_0006063800 [Aspergillus terreus]|nr:hypothetical protein ATETN484_0006063800 [Aspergillus terreus]